MADVEISYNGDTIVSMSDSGTEYLDTKGLFMVDNVTVNYTKSGGGVTTVSFSDNAAFGADKIIYVDGNGAVQIESGYIAMYSACSYQMQSGSIIVLFGDLMNGGAQYIDVPSTITLINSGTIPVTARQGSTGTLSWAVFQVN